MAFYHKIELTARTKTGDVKKWYPRSITVGKSVTTENLAKRISQECTVAPADVLAVLKALSGVMGDYMAMGRSVKLDGIGSFYFAATAAGNGTDTAGECSAANIAGVRVRFIPETRFHKQTGGRRAVRPLSDVTIEWIDVDTIVAHDDEGNDGE